MGRRRKHSDIERFGELLDPSDTLYVLSKAVPSSFEQVFCELEKPEGMGRKRWRQYADHYLALLDSVATARREGRLNTQQMTEYVTVLKNLFPILERIKKLHGRVPEEAEEDARLYGSGTP